ncbi:DNA-binding protein [Sodalis endosymbiont of Spalangia cameroni]|uniref:DNA-binding protein n=1 Tax=Sodalis praecaptivus TaxID=1239307 RepID=UPI0031F88933
MSNITINIEVPTPYVPLKKYSEMTGIPFDSCRRMVADGRIIIRPKHKAKDRVEVNLVAMLKDAIENS